MAIVTIEKNRYTVESLYQWDLNQVFKVYGLSLATIPEIHFTNDAMDRAIVRQATMDDAGVITAEIPNSLLQKPYTIKAYICTYEGDTFESLYSLTIPIKARTKPADYTIEDTDGEIYSFNALENLVINTVREIMIENNALEDRLTGKYDAINEDVTEALAEIEVISEDIKAQLSEAENVIGGYENRVKELETNGLKRDDVVDNLLSESENLPLSAKQGKVLNDKAEGLINKSYLKCAVDSTDTIAMNTTDKKIPLKEFVKYSDNFYVLDGNIYVENDCTVEILVSAYCADGWTTGDGVSASLKRTSDNAVVCQISQHVQNAWEGFLSSDLAQLNAGDILTFYAKNGTSARGKLSKTDYYTYVILKEL